LSLDQHHGVTRRVHKRNAACVQHRPAADAHILFW
jgi:hypothetical protein